MLVLTVNCVKIRQLFATEGCSVTPGEVLNWVPRVGMALSWERSPGLERYGLAMIDSCA